MGVFYAHTMLEVASQAPPVTSHEAVNSVFFLVYVGATPVFIVEIKPPGSLRFHYRGPRTAPLAAGRFRFQPKDPVFGRSRFTSTLMTSAAWKPGITPRIGKHDTYTDAALQE